MDSIVDRLNKIVKNHLFISGRAFASKLEMKSTTVNNYLNGTREPNFEFLNKILSTFEDISAEWLMRGEGEMIREDDKTSEALMREITDLKMQLLVKEGVIKELKDVLIERNGGKIPDSRKSLVG